MRANQKRKCQSVQLDKTRRKYLCSRVKTYMMKFQSCYETQMHFLPAVMILPVVNESRVSLTLLVFRLMKKD